jgi:hypothetical protein
MKERYLVLVVGVWKGFNARTNIMGTSCGFMDTTGQQYESLSLFLSLSVLFFLIIIILGFIFFLSDDGVFVH